MNYAVPECVNQSRCRPIVIEAMVPLDVALPLYGYVMPLIVAITIATNSFIVLVLSHRSLRTPTNYVLLGMAVTELLTGLSCLPWLLYYYTFGGYLTDREQGLPAFWCVSFPYMASVLPSMFHMAAIWSTVYLAVQRYVYICHPKFVANMCTIEKTRQVLLCICVVSVGVYAPELFATYNESFAIRDSLTATHIRNICLRWRTRFVEMVGANIYHYVIYTVHALFSHALPCVLLVVFTMKLIRAIRQADKRHLKLRAPKQQQKQVQVETSTTTDGVLDKTQRSVQSLQTALQASPTSYKTPISIEPSGNKVLGPPEPDYDSASTDRRGSTALLGRTTQLDGRGRGSVCESKRVQGLRQNTRMLITVIIMFLITEIPAAMIFSIHVSTVALSITYFQRHYAVLNKLLIVRNVLIVVTYPMRFAIYCGMSQQFREVVRQMLSHKGGSFFPSWLWSKAGNAGSGVFGGAFRTRRLSRTIGNTAETMNTLVPLRSRPNTNASEASPSSNKQPPSPKPSQQQSASERGYHGYPNLFVDHRAPTNDGTINAVKETRTEGDELWGYRDFTAGEAMVGVSASSRQSSIKQSIQQMNTQARAAAIPHDLLAEERAQQDDCLL